MPSNPKAFIAGVGFSPQSSTASPSPALVSAATKALLDAGVTYDDVTRVVSTATFNPSDALKAFDVNEAAVAVEEAERGSELQTAFRCVKNRGAQCVLMLALEESAATAFVITSDAFIWTHHYLKESSVLLRDSDASRVTSQGLHSVCQIVWTLRGWSHGIKTPSQADSFVYKGGSGHGIELSRADGKDIPGWDEVEYRQDGKHRLGYNPAVDTKDISQEDLEAIRAGAQDHGKTAAWTRLQRKGGDRAALARL